MKKIKITIISSIIFVSLLLVGTFVYAFFFLDETHLTERTFGEVDVVGDIYFMKDNNRFSANRSSFYNEEYTKTAVYEIVLSDLQDERHLNNLRVDFLVNSSINTYFRVKLYDSIVLINANGDRETTLANTGIKYRFKDYDPDVEYVDDDGDSEFWFLDKRTNWFYFKNEVNGLNEEVRIPFIIDTTSYEGPTQNRKLELVLKIEAVQAYRGPFENWGLIEKPWPNGGEW